MLEYTLNEALTESNNAVNSACRLIRSASHVVALVGAGMSVESGIPPFRGPGGIWTKYGASTSLNYHTFLEDPAKWWQNRLRDEMAPGNPTYEMKIAVDEANPNPGHYALVELERMGILKYTITQNIDDLHRRAGSIKVAEIHGNRTKLRCLGCGIRVPRNGFPIEHVPPTCTGCGGIIKIDSVMFGEPIPKDVMGESLEQIQKCDCMLMIGTSGTVKPAASFPIAARSRGARLIEINPDDTNLTPMADLVVRGFSAEVLPKLVAAIRESRDN